MKFDSIVKAQYSQLSQEQKAQLPKIHRMATLPYVIAQTCVTLFVFIYGYITIEPVIGASVSINEALFLPALLKVIVLAAVGYLIAFIIKKISISTTVSKHKFYTEQLGEYDAYIRRRK